MKQFFITEEDTGVFNIFDREDDFDENGYYYGHSGEQGYHISDFDVTAEFDTFEEACDWLDEH